MLIRDRALAPSLKNFTIGQGDIIMRQKLKEDLIELAARLHTVGKQMYNEPIDDKDEERLYILHGLELKATAVMVQGWLEEEEDA